MKKVIIELEIPDNFEVCNNDNQSRNNSNCPFTSWNKEDCCYSCGYNVKFDCPMQNMKST